MRGQGSRWTAGRCVTSAATIPAVVCSAAVTTSVHPAARATAAVTGPMQAARQPAGVAATASAKWRSTESRSA